MSSPKYLNILTDSRAIPLSVMVVVGNTLVVFQKMRITLHFVSLNDMKVQLD